MTKSSRNVIGFRSTTLGLTSEQFPKGGALMRDFPVEAHPISWVVLLCTCQCIRGACRAVQRAIS